MATHIRPSFMTTNHSLNTLQRQLSPISLPNPSFDKLIKLDTDNSLRYHIRKQHQFLMSLPKYMITAVVLVRAKPTPTDDCKYDDAQLIVDGISPLKPQP